MIVYSLIRGCCVLKLTRLHFVREYAASGEVGFSRTYTGQAIGTILLVVKSGCSLFFVTSCIIVHHDMRSWSDLSKIGNDQNQELFNHTRLSIRSKLSGSVSSLAVEVRDRTQ